jgi:hypothetical protein
LVGLHRLVSAPPPIGADFLGKVSGEGVLRISPINGQQGDGGTL